MLAVPLEINISVAFELRDCPYSFDNPVDGNSCADTLVRRECTESVIFNCTQIPTSEIYICHFSTEEYTCKNLVFFREKSKVLIL